MATTNEIKTKLTLDGVKEATDQLKALGTEGEAAFKKITAAADKVAPGIGGKLEQSIASFKKSFADLGKASADVSKSFAAVQRSSAEVGIAFASVAARVALAVGAIGAAAGALGKFTQIATESADAVGKAAQGLGLTTKAYQELAFAAAQSGLSVEDFTAGFTRLNVVIGDALAGNEQAIKKFKDLGIALTDANGKARPAEEVFKDLAEAIARIPDGARRAAVGSDFFGKSVGKWLPLILEGREGIEALQKQFAASGLGFTDKEIENATKFNDSLSALLTTLRQLRDKVFINLAEPFRRAFDAINQVVIENATQILAAANNLANRIGPIFDDIVQSLLGNDANVKAEWVTALKNQIIEFGTAVYQVFTNVLVPAFNLFETAANGVASVISVFIPGEINGQALLLALAIGKVSGAFTLLTASVGLAKNSFLLLRASLALLGPLFASTSAFFPIIVSGVQVVLAALAALVSWPVLIGAAIGAALSLIYIYWDEIVAYSLFAWEAIQNGTSAAWNVISSIVAQAWESIKQSAAIAWESIRGYAEMAWNGVVSTIAAIGSSITEIWSSVTNSITGLWDSATNFIISAANNILGWISGVISSIRSAIAYALQLIGLNNGNNGPGYAGGGYITGPGTGTSDSIPAWLSNGEYVIRASAVKKYGPGLFAALNQMRLPRDVIPRFNMGGLVDSLSASIAPRFAMGGMVALAAPAGGGRPVNVTIGNEMFAMNAPEDVAEKLIKYASRRKVASAGRKPSWYGA